MSETDTTTVGRVTRLVTPILADLKLDLYDLEYRGGTLRVTVDVPRGDDAGDDERGVDLDQIALATRLISRELDHEDPVAGHYTLEVSSPGLERSLRTPAHYARSLGAAVAVRLRDIGEGGERRINGVLESADDDGITVRTDGGDERTIPYSHVDRAKTVFVWGPTPKPGQPKKQKKQEKEPKR
ncbi:MAG: ribosome maturation factor RimP [Ilumatobacteraceae bacterium]